MNGRERTSQTIGGRLGAGWVALCLSLSAGALPAAAATYYVDGSCPSSGSGATDTCGSTGPKRTISEGVALIGSPGDVLNIRGAHGSFDGRYTGNQWAINLNGKHGTSTSPIIIQAYGWSGIGKNTQEAVYLDGTGNPGTWSQCTDCTAGTCAGVPGVCSQVWYVVPTSSGMSLASGAQKDDGTPTRRMTSISGITNQYDSYVPSYSSGARLFVRWGTALPQKPYVFLDNSRAFNIQSSSYITIQGFRVRCTEDAFGYINDTSSDIVIRDNVLRYALGNPSGGDYGFYLFRSNRTTIDSNEIGWTGSEGLHTEALLSDAPTTFTITNNWIHHSGDQSVIGPGTSGTPNGMTIATSGPTEAGAGNYQGSVVAGNLVENISGPVFAGINLENHVDNLVLRDNVVINPGSQCIVATSAAGTSNNGNKIYNNLLINCADKARGQASILLYSGSGKSISNNLIYNNTMINPVGVPAIAMYCNGGTCVNNVFRNNILYDSGSKKMVDIPNQGTSTGNVFENNLVYSATLSGGSTLINWLGNNYTCGTIGNLSPTNKCVNPQFAGESSKDYHLQATSPGVNAGTSTGMPAGRVSIFNNLANNNHGFPPAGYADGWPMQVAWDMGATELATPTGPPSATIALVPSVSQLPLPPKVGIGAIAITLTTSVPVVSLPGPLTLTESDSSQTTITLTGTVPGNVFLGTLNVDSTLADGTATFSLPASNLVDASGNRGNTINTPGNQAIINATPPATPTNTRRSDT